MAIDSVQQAALEFLLQVDRFYAALISCVSQADGLDTEPGLGGRLLYVGELDGAGRALVVAGNIAGAASLTATADGFTQKQAIRDGVVDFLVTSLDEALRILKNEIRKRQPVAVCVAAAPEVIEREMLERGVQPDWVGPTAAGSVEGARFLRQGGLRIEPAVADERQAVAMWSVAAAPARWLPKLDALALDCLSRDSSPAAGAARRWLRLAPRYLGRMAQGVRLLRCEQQAATEFQARVREAVERGEIGVPVEMRVSCRGNAELSQFSPPEGR
jgi:hypothetical protein